MSRAASIPTTGAARPRAGLVERLGRSLVVRALSRLEWGAVELSEEGRVSARGGSGGPSVRVTVQNPRFFSAALRGATSFGDAYIDGWWTSDDLPTLIEILTVNEGALASIDAGLARLLGPVRSLALLTTRNSRPGSRRNIRAHYDLSNEFFALWLDPSMTYSSAIFEPPTASLEEAQEEKIDRACRRLGLRRGQSLLEIGTGWGALALHAAERHGARVVTTTISDAQHAYVAQRIEERGLGGRITLLKSDYRDLPRLGLTFDRIVSIEMIEAVGHEGLRPFFDVCSRLLAPDGAMLLQAITIRERDYEGARRRQDFLKKHIFPGSCLTSIGAIARAVAATTDLSFAGVEDITPHYVRTLAEWRDRFDARGDDVRALGLDDRFIRMWGYYLAYCEGVFRARKCGDIQALLVKPRWRGDALGRDGGGR